MCLLQPVQWNPNCLCKALDHDYDPVPTGYVLLYMTDENIDAL